MSSMRTGGSHEARKLLFQLGLRRGFLTVQEIEAALPQGSLTPSERWLLYYSLRAAEIGLRDEEGRMSEVAALSPEEREQLAAERSGGPYTEQERHAQSPEADELRLGLAEESIPLDS